MSTYVYRYYTKSHCTLSGGGEGQTSGSGWGPWPSSQIPIDPPATKQCFHAIFCRIQVWLRRIPFCGVGGFACCFLHTPMKPITFRMRIEPINPIKSENQMTAKRRPRSWHCWCSHPGLLLQICTYAVQYDFLVVICDRSCRFSHRLSVHG